MKTWNLDGLRKHAKAKSEAPMSMKKRERATEQVFQELFASDPVCACGYRKSSHDPKHWQYNFYRSEGMCDLFQEVHP